MKKILFLILSCMFAQSSVDAMEQKQQAPAAAPRKKLTFVRPGQRVAEVAQTPVLPIVQQTPTEGSLVAQPVTIVEQMAAAEPVTVVEATAPVEVAQSQEPSVNAIVNRGGTLLELIYTKHARERMEERNISELDIELAIEYGNKFLDTKHPDCIVYQSRSVKTSQYPVFVATRIPRRDHPNKIVIKTVHPAYPIGCEKKSGKPVASAVEMKKMGTVTETQLNKLREQIERKREEKTRDAQTNKARMRKENRDVARKDAAKK